MALSQIMHLSFISIVLSLAVISSAGNAEYGPITSKADKPKLEKEKEKLLSSLIGVQGLIYCKSPSKFIPLQGAVARITCVGVDEYGYETAPFSILSEATDAKGYFLATLSPKEVEENWKIKECKTFLELSPSYDNTCNVPTNVNSGIDGALLTSSRFLGDKNMKLFTVGPFFYTSDVPKSVANNGY
ncbi:protein SEED AND ROOT HAIR PROTECTIVE PROTEIN-like [Euphorbia lathyris]|uniref:protein SEED AND ROOT HAIR PROTECTIVE PROTEIN-like n=1 Tax=Euphorbia lathyris TaxID=212925 RepID=UPI003313B607